MTPAPWPTQRSDCSPAQESSLSGTLRTGSRSSREGFGRSFGRGMRGLLARFARAWNSLVSTWALASLVSTGESLFRKSPSERKPSSRSRRGLSATRSTSRAKTNRGSSEPSTSTARSGPRYELSEPILHFDEPRISFGFNFGVTLFGHTLSFDYFKEKDEGCDCDEHNEEED